MKFVTVLCATLALAACGPDEESKSGIDQCLRATIFAQCMAALPRGPERLTAAGNDWAEVVEECADSAKAQAYRTQHTIKPECRAWGAPAGKVAP
jgi:hypothetical protein